MSSPTERAKRLLASYGVAPERWPEHERSLFSLLDVQELAAARELDQMLDSWQPEVAPAQLHDVLHTQIPQMSGLELLLFWLGQHLMRPVTAFGLPLLIGIALAQLPAPQQQETIEDIWIEHIQSQFTFTDTTTEEYP